MNREHILKSNEEFQRIIKNNKPNKFNKYILYIEKNNSDTYNFGFSVGKKIGHAVVRNKIKRQLRSIVSKNKYRNGFNCIIIVTGSYLDSTYQEIELSLNSSLKKLNLLEEK